MAISHRRRSETARVIRRRINQIIYRSWHIYDPEWSIFLDEPNRLSKFRPCSCGLCRGEKYRDRDRKRAKQELRVLS